MGTKSRARTANAQKRRSKKASSRRETRRVKAAAELTILRKSAVAGKNSKSELARRLARVIVQGLEDASVEKVVALFPQVQSIGRQIRKIVAEAADTGAGTVEALRGEGLRVIEGEVGRHALEASLGRARKRGDAAVAEIPARPEMLTGEEFADRANTSRETVNRWRNERRVLGLEGNTRGVRYPAWQIDEHGLVMKEMAGFLAEIGDPWLAYRFLTNDLPEFDGLTGLEVLSQGRGAALAMVVRRFGETF